MKLSKKILIFISFLITVKATAQTNTSLHFYHIPAQIIKPYIMIGYDEKYAKSVASYYNDKTEKQIKFQMKIDSFEVSDQITFGEYKKYLAAIKKDSSEEFYLKQLPDSSIGTPEVYRQYVTGNSYDNLPVLGISWESAFNYCKWKTVQDNKGTTILFIYRLPICSEWLTANDYLNKVGIKNDFNKNYSDWLMNSKFDGDYLKDSSFSPYDAVVLPRNARTDAHMDRRFVIGRSFLFEKENFYEYYQYNYFKSQGYRGVGFRIVKQNKMDTYIYNGILNSWGLPK